MMAVTVTYYILYLLTSCITVKTPNRTVASREMEVTNTPPWGESDRGS